VTKTRRRRVIAEMTKSFSRLLARWMPLAVPVIVQAVDLVFLGLCTNPVGKVSRARAFSCDGRGYGATTSEGCAKVWPPDGWTTRQSSSVGR